MHSIVMFIGWESSSWGYHNDGQFFCCSENGELYGPSFTADDIIGCFLNFRNNTVFYTKNGVNLGIAFQDLKGILYPCVGMSQGCSVKVNFGHDKFEYVAVAEDDINDETLSGKWNEVFILCNNKQIDKYIMYLTKSLKTKQNNNNQLLKYRGKANFIIGRYEEALADFKRLLERDNYIEFALKYQAETYHIMGK